MKNLSYSPGLLLLTIALSLNAFSQNDVSDSLQIDSLKKILLHEKEDTNKVNTLNKLSYLFYVNNNSTNATDFANTALGLAQKTNFKKGISNAYRNLGHAYMNEGIYNEALKNYLVALGISQQIMDSMDIARVFVDIGDFYRIQNNYDAAKNNYYNALVLYKDLRNNPALINTYNMLCYIYGNMYDFDSALKYGFEALKLGDQVKNKAGAADAYFNIGATYADQDNYEESLKYYMLSLSKYEEIGDNIKMAMVYIQIGYIYSEKNIYSKSYAYLIKGLKIYNESGNRTPPIRLIATYESIGLLEEKEGVSLSDSNKISARNKFMEAEQRYKSALQISERIKSQFAKSEIYLGLGKLYIDLKQYAKSRYYLILGLQLTMDFGDPENIPDAYKSLSILDSIQGNFEQAYNHYKLYAQYHDSLVNTEAIKKSTQVSMQYEFDKKEDAAKTAQDKKDAAAKRIKNQQYFAIAALGIVVLAVIIISIIQFRNNKQKQKANLLLERQKEKVEGTLAELKSTQAQLIQSEKMASLGELTAGIAHEIQNPLNFMNNFSEVNVELIDEMRQEMKIGKITDADIIAANIRENELKINHHGKRADAIVKGMLQHSRTSAGQMEPTDINALADEYLRLSYHGLRAKDNSFNATMKTDFNSNIGKINIIAQDIGRVLLNLYNNAFYAVNEKSKLGIQGYVPTISVSTKKMNDKVELKVTDNGNGIPQKVVDKIFQPFFTTKPTGQGTGLGLSLSYDILKAHGGEIKVETKEGEGSEFIIQLPSAS
jgi:two-component system, NtrC family, sensor kinase